MAAIYSNELQRRATRAELALKAEFDRLGWKYVFQSPQVGTGRRGKPKFYIADFRLWMGTGDKLLIEVDGSVHIGRQLQDERRSQWLRCHKQASIVRFTNEQVLERMPEVIERLMIYEPKVNQ